tara:strand:+ start:1859 stop:2095 length:237 start_codon:yes stop_codon:yes gene_type:complete
MSFVNHQELLTESVLNKMYDDFSREQQNLMVSMKDLNEDEMAKEGDITKQISLMNTINISLMRLRNLKRKIKMKNDLV